VSIDFLFITGHYKPALNSGGPVNSVSSMAEALVALGHSVTVIALNEDDGVVMDVPIAHRCWINGVSVYYFAASSPMWRRFRRSRSGIRKWSSSAITWLKKKVVEFDVVHLQIGLLQPATLVAKLAQKHRKILCYHQRGNLDPRRFGRAHCLKSLYIRVIERQALDRASVLFALSAREEVTYLKWSENSNIVRLPNGVHFEQWCKPEQTTSSPAGAGLLFVWSARWDIRKGALEFIAACQGLGEHFPSATFKMVGPTWGEDLEVVRAAVDASHLDRLELIAGASEDERRAIIQNADYFILPTYGEGFSVAILEAMAAEAVVVTTPEANFPELEYDRVGCLCSRSSDAIVARVLNLESEPEGRQRMSRRATQYVAEKYQWKSIVDVYLDTITPLLEN
tara:strand:- start:1466 stop:2653 length:1188 start_codon:yes stop_codon:yes gene_type:complete